MLLLLLLLGYGDDCYPQWLCAGSTVADRMRSGREMRRLRFTRGALVARVVCAPRRQCDSMARTMRLEMLSMGDADYREGGIECTALEEHT